MLNNDFIKNIKFISLYLCNKDGKPSHIYLIAAPQGVFICLSLWFFLRTKTSSFHHPCQRSRQSPSCRQGRTRAWTLLWTSSGKRPGKDWWQPSGRRQYDRTPPQKAPIASKSTSLRPRPDSEDGPAPIIEPNCFGPLQTLIDTNTNWSEHRVQRMHRGRSTADDRSVEITGQHTDLQPPAMGLNHPDRCLILLLLPLLLLLLRL